MGKLIQVKPGELQTGGGNGPVLKLPTGPKPKTVSLKRSKLKGYMSKYAIAYILYKPFNSSRQENPPPAAGGSKKVVWAALGIAGAAILALIIYALLKGIAHLK